MYEPVFNSVLVEIDDKDAEWGSGNDESMLGKSFSKGRVVRVAQQVPTQDYPTVPKNIQVDFEGRKIMWNEGVEAGTTFEHDGKLYGMIYWWDIRACKADNT